MSTVDALEGEILQRRFAVLNVLSQHGDWVRCRVHDMESHARCEAMVRLGGEGEPEVELLPDDQTPPPVDLPADVPFQAAAPPPPPPVLSATAEAPAEASPDPAPSTERSQKPGRLEAAWFATGVEAEEAADEEQRDEDDGDILIAPSKVEQVAVDLTTGTYRRYALDGTPAQPVAGVASGASVPVMTPVMPTVEVPAAPVASGNRKTLLVVALVLLGVGLATLMFALLY